MPVRPAGRVRAKNTALRCQCGQNSGHQCATRKLPNAVVALRSQRGYWATEYDASVDQFPETLRPQIGRSYDAKKVRNRQQTRRTVHLDFGQPGRCSFHPPQLLTPLASRLAGSAGWIPENHFVPSQPIPMSSSALLLPRAALDIEMPSHPRRVTWMHAHPTSRSSDASGRPWTR